ncbi:MAG: GlsB/YeaQ/YmgE family stress response membrane protein [Pseudobutyrivibrio sp.]|nr:GlsB/YeaQ/YmgE family stress response membrane protein [Pseudobutyrivibrio sp.]
MGIIISLIVGGLSGWIAGQIMKTTHGVIVNIILGIVGGAVGGFLLSIIGLGGATNIIGSIVVSVFGACVLIALGKALFK